MGCFIISRELYFYRYWRLGYRSITRLRCFNELWTEINCRFITCYIAVIIPARQYPFQSWLIESVVAPTPVSAIMHVVL